MLAPEVLGTKPSGHAWQRLTLPYVNKGLIRLDNQLERIPEPHSSRRKGQLQGLGKLDSVNQHYIHRLVHQA
ncbi:hypothetical protein D3C79_850850 [compost metagenome]